MQPDIATIKQMQLTVINLSPEDLLTAAVPSPLLSAYSCQSRAQLWSLLWQQLFCLEYKKIKKIISYKINLFCQVVVVDGNHTGDEQREMDHFKLCSMVSSGETRLPPSISSWGMVGTIARCNISVISWFYHSKHCVAPQSKSNYVLPHSWQQLTREK